jgi:hypothetical protein
MSSLWREGTERGKIGVVRKPKWGTLAWTAAFCLGRTSDWAVPPPGGRYWPVGEWVKTLFASTCLSNDDVYNAWVSSFGLVSWSAFCM